MQSAFSPAVRRPCSKTSIVVWKLLGSWREVCLRKAAHYAKGINKESTRRNAEGFSGSDDTYHHGMRLATFNTCVYKKRVVSKFRYRKMFTGRRTGLSRFLRPWHLDGLFGVVDMLWPVVIERPELHGRRIVGLFNESEVKDAFCFDRSSETPHSGWGSHSL